MARVIAIDGPSGAGKSSISRLLAGRLGFQFLDTGALYRATALYLAAMGIISDAPDQEIRAALEGISVRFCDGRVFVNNEDLSDRIRTPEAGIAASSFSARHPVRAFLLSVQREAALHADIVAEGRDMTTVVFPDAWKKFYLDASEEGRAMRRYLQLREMGMAITMEEALRDVRIRDEKDSSREISPLKRADDAVYIDTSAMSPDEVMERIIDCLSL
ncbi:MAG: (d)CMP kinase [Nitrospirales bacterium]|nr:(d)CMP kinase [Nitrospirales bacterium]